MSAELKDFIILNKGSIQNIKTIPKLIKEVYKTSWDLSQKALIDQAADRGVYVCQSQSLNLFQEDPSAKKLSQYAFLCLEKRIKNRYVLFKNSPCYYSTAIYN